jgi:glycosyltransferase involved in cell wall biosynthesis
MGGGQVNIRHLHRCYKEKGIDCFVLTNLTEGQKSYEIDNGMKVYRVKFGEKGYVKDALSIIKKEDTGIIHSFVCYPPAIRICFNSKLKLGTKVIFSLIGKIGEQQNPFLKLFTLLFSDKITIMCKYGKKSFISFPILNKKYEYVPNGIFLEKFFVSKKKKNIILSVGRIHRQKDYATLLYGCMNLPQFKNYKLIIVGGIEDEGYFRELTRITDDDNLKGKVTFLTDISENELSRLYSEAKLFVLSTTHEMFPAVVLESMASGTPVIASGNTGIPESVGDAGILFDTGDCEQLGMIMERLLDNRKMYNEIVKKGLAHSRNFSFENMADRYIKIYNLVNK